MLQQPRWTLIGCYLAIFVSGPHAQEIGPAELGINLELQSELFDPQEDVTMPPGLGNVEINSDTIDLFSAEALSERLLSPAVTIDRNFTFDLDNPLGDNRPTEALDLDVRAQILLHNRDVGGLEALAKEPSLSAEVGQTGLIFDFADAYALTEAEDLSAFAPADVDGLLSNNPNLTDTGRAIVWERYLEDGPSEFAGTSLARIMAYAPESADDSFTILLTQSDPGTRDALIAEWLSVKDETTDPFALGALYDRSYAGFELPEGDVPFLAPEEILFRLSEPGEDPVADHLRARIERDRGNLSDAVMAFQRATAADDRPATALTDFARFSRENPTLDGVWSSNEVVRALFDGLEAGDFRALPDLVANEATPDATRIAATVRASSTANTPAERAIAAQAERNLCAAYDATAGGGLCEAPSMMFFTNRARSLGDGFSNDPSSGDAVYFGRLEVPLLSELYRQRDDLGLIGAGACLTETNIAQRFLDCNQNIVRNVSSGGSLAFEASDASTFGEAVQPSDQFETPQAVIYIHGFNNSLEDAARDFARVILTARLRGQFQPILISWPSQASAIFDEDGRLSMPQTPYRIDRQRVREACSEIRSALNDVEAAYSAENVHILAHSMGAYMLHQVLTGCPSAPTPAEPIAEPIARNIILSAADLATNVFEADRDLILGAAQRVTIYIAPSDPVLQFSSEIDRQQGGVGDGPRLGSGFDALTNAADDSLMIVNTLFAEFVETASGPTLYNTNHSYHINTPAVRRDIAMLLRGHELDQAERCLAGSDDMLSEASNHPRRYFIVPNCL